jgi:putative membrane protein
MKIDLLHGRRVLQNSLVLATTLIACAALQANEHEDKKAGDKAHKEHADKGGPMTAEKFIQKAQASGLMEVQMGQLGQQQAQNQEVKNLAAALVRDHTQANQKLQQIASAKNVTLDQKERAKHEKHIDQLKSKSGADFDKEFVRMALQHHKKDIAEFERCRNLTDQELKSFISETLPKLRQHQQMARTAARSVGVDEASIAAEVDDDDTSAAGAAGGAVSGTREGQGRDLGTPDRSRSPQDRPRSSLDGAIDADASGTINQNNPSLKAEGRIGDEEISAKADVDTEADVDVESDGNKVFQKGDGKVLGLPTSKTDGKFLGIIPNPRADNDKKDADVEVKADVDTDTDDGAVGGSAKVETGSSKKDQ